MLGQINLPAEPSGYGRLISRLTALFQRVDAELSRLTYRGEATWNPANLVAGATTTTTITVPNAGLGDAVRVFPPYSLQGLVCTAYVSAANTVTVVLLNPTGGAVDLASGTWRVACEKY